MREHIDEIVSADLRGKLAWYFRDNRKYWENINLNKSGVRSKDSKEESTKNYADNYSTLAT